MSRYNYILLCLLVEQLSSLSTSFTDVYFGYSLAFSTSLGVVYLAKSPAVSRVAIHRIFCKTLLISGQLAFLTSEVPTFILVANFVIRYHPWFHHSSA